MALFDRIVDKNLLVRRVNIAVNRVVDETSGSQPDAHEQLDLFTDYEAMRHRHKVEEAALARERRTQEAVLAIRQKLGKNMILKGMNLEEGATAQDRNQQIGGHKA